VAWSVCLGFIFWERKVRYPELSRKTERSRCLFMALDFFIT